MLSHVRKIFFILISNSLLYSTLLLLSLLYTTLLYSTLLLLTSSFLFSHLIRLFPFHHLASSDLLFPILSSYMTISFPSPCIFWPPRTVLSISAHTAFSLATLIGHLRTSWFLKFNLKYSCGDSYHNK